MQNLTIYILEDEPLYQNKLSMILDKMGYDLTGKSDNSDVALREILEKQPDLLLLDIEIDGSMDGIELAEQVNKQQKIPCIFITSFRDEETFSRAKATLPHAYITKPFEEEELQRAIELAIMSTDRWRVDQEPAWGGEVLFKDSIFIKTRSRIDKVDTKDILYIEVEDRYCTVFMDNGKKYVLRMSMGDVYGKLPSDLFSRTHRKYCVNLSKVSSMDLKDNVLFVGDMNIPINRKYKDLLVKRLDYLQ